MNINHDITAYEKTMKQFWLVNERTFADYEIQQSKKKFKCTSSLVATLEQTEHNRHFKKKDNKRKSMYCD